MEALKASVELAQKNKKPAATRKKTSKKIFNRYLGMENSFFEPMKPIHYPRFSTMSVSGSRSNGTGSECCLCGWGKVVLSNINAKDKTIQFPELSAMPAF
jgi:hypothetical protein